MSCCGENSNVWRSGVFNNSDSDMHEVVQPVSTKAFTQRSPTLSVISATILGLGSCFKWVVGFPCTPALPWAGAVFRNPHLPGH